MPESVNGMAVAGMGHMEGKTGDHFLFTSESVGEGHPGMEYQNRLLYEFTNKIKID